MQITSYIILFSLIGLGTFAEAMPPVDLTAEQRSCIESTIRSLGYRPPMDEMMQILQGCGVDKPPVPPKFAELSESERNCLVGQIGDPMTREQRPSKSEMKSAFAACNIDPPAPRHSSNFRTAPRGQQNYDHNPSGSTSTR